MARISPISGNCVEDFEIAVVKYLTRNLPDGYCIYHNVDLPNDRQGGSFDLDVVVVGPTGLYLVEVKNWFGTLSNQDQFLWELRRRLPNGREERCGRARADRGIAVKAHILYSHLRERFGPDGHKLPNAAGLPNVQACVLFPDPPRLSLAVEHNIAADLLQYSQLADYVQQLRGRQRELLGKPAVSTLCAYLDQHLGGIKAGTGNQFEHYDKRRRLWVNEDEGLGYRVEAWLASNLRLEEKEVQLYIFSQTDSARTMSERQKTWEHLEKTKRALVRLNHPATPRVMNQGGDMNTRHVWLEVDAPRPVLKGVPLAELLREHREQGCPLALHRVSSIFTQLVDALEHAHRNRVYHRGLGAQNIYVAETDDGAMQLGISDFASARIGGYPTIRPSFRPAPYTAPELLSAVAYTPETPAEQFVKMDVYSVGALLLECLTLIDLTKAWPVHRPLSSFALPADLMEFQGTAETSEEWGWFWGDLGFDVRQMVAPVSERYASFADLKAVLELISPPHR